VAWLTSGSMMTREIARGEWADGLRREKINQSVGTVRQTRSQSRLSIIVYRSHLYISGKVENVKINTSSRLTKQAYSLRQFRPVLPVNLVIVMAVELR